ncbi:hypothetical protein JOB18_005223 [Solea senegalensis]|uniref:Uncharacterized protein n=1 Tax=Solea senegalensis TaxID=28829 RepID=A0AAV6SEB3_SOLSE|nr:hypothetical protein JOB18_005223 [Solea senegalensis]
MFYIQALTTSKPNAPPRERTRDSRSKAVNVSVWTVAELRRPFIMVSYRNCQSKPRGQRSQHGTAFVAIISEKTESMQCHTCPERFFISSSKMRRISCRRQRACVSTLLVLSQRRYTRVHDEVTAAAHRADAEKNAAAVRTKLLKHWSFCQCV